MIRDETTGWSEAEIIIEGQRLTFVQSMALRVAMTSYQMFLSEPKNKELIGEGLAEGYLHHLGKVAELMKGRQTWEPSTAKGKTDGSKDKTDGR